ncbi:uncharacterized protein UTRI_10542 [Ustilago trichophora]|uniref:Uncharacterized protein n=1 Tax=Ustilago trichophora TaxID=86804 RepID=A0A5C3EBN1_9BASI|nr:uncharacterized protein UTRI_10542 [Ustilago trichophora]
MVQLLARLGMTGAWYIVTLFAFSTSLPLGNHYEPPEGWHQNHDAVGFSPSPEIASFHHPYDDFFGHVNSPPNQWPYESFPELQPLPGSLNVGPFHQSMSHTTLQGGFDSDQHVTRFEHGENGAQGMWHQNWPQHSPEVQPNDVLHDASWIRHPAEVEESGKNTVDKASHSLYPVSTSERPVKVHRTVQRIASALRQGTLKRPAESTLEGLRLGVPISRPESPTTLASSGSSSLHTGSPRLVPSNSELQAEPTASFSGAGSHDTTISETVHGNRNKPGTAGERKVFRGLFGRTLPMALNRIPETDPPFEKSKELDTRTSFKSEPLHLEEIREKINSKVFAGQLQWVPRHSFTQSQFRRHREVALRQSRLLSNVEIPIFRIPEDGGTIQNVRMTVHGGSNLLGKQYDGSILAGRTWYSFWGIPEGRHPYGPKISEVLAVLRLTQDSLGKLDYRHFYARVHELAYTS